MRDAAIALNGNMWHLFMLTVMPDHVHLLVKPLHQSPERWFSLSVILQRLKGSSALTINRMRGRQGTFRQRESFDRIVRDVRECDEKATYILNNAAKAGLIEDGWEYDGLWCNNLSLPRD